MSTYISTEVVYAGLVRQKAAYQTLRTRFSPAQANINHYLSDNSLAGRAFSANKRYFKEGHLPALRQIERTLTTAVAITNRHIILVNSILRPHGWYNQSTINQNIIWATASITGLNVLIATVGRTVAWASGLIRMREDRRAFKREWINRRDRLEAYINATNALYDGMDTPFSTLERLLRRIELASPCPQTGAMVLPSMTEVILADLMNKDGTPNWDAIEELLARDVEGICENELDALAEVYISLDSPDDLARFINAMGVKIGPGHDMSGAIDPGWMLDSEREAFLERNTIWYFDPVLTNAIRARVELRIANLLEQEINDSITTGEEHFRLLQNSALLYVVSILTPVHFEDTDRNALMYERPGETRANPRISEVLFGTADSPGITITPGEDGSWNVGFAQLDKYLNMNDDGGVHTLPMPDNSADRKHLMNYQVREINISRAYGPGGDGKELSRAIHDRVQDSALSNYEFNVAESVVGAAASFGVGFVPGSDIAGAIVGPFQDFEETKKVRNTINEVSSAGRLAEEARANKLNGVFISEEGSYQTPLLWFSSEIMEDTKRQEAPSGIPGGLE